MNIDINHSEKYKYPNAIIYGFKLNGDKYKICDLYLNIKRNINKINGKYTFKMNFLLSRIMQIIGKKESKI